MRRDEATDRRDPRPTGADLAATRRSCRPGGGRPYLRGAGGDCCGSSGRAVSTLAGWLSQRAGTRATMRCRANGPSGSSSSGAGFGLGMPSLSLSSPVLIAHVGMDRAVGYGLKLRVRPQRRISVMGRRGPAPGDTSAGVQAGAMSPARARRRMPIVAAASPPRAGARGRDDTCRGGTGGRATPSLWRIEVGALLGGINRRRALHGGRACLAGMTPACDRTTRARYQHARAP
jgi:hypothetical protein